MIRVIKKNRFFFGTLLLLVCSLLLGLQAGYIYERNKSGGSEEETVRNSPVTEEGGGGEQNTVSEPEPDTRVTEADGTLISGVSRQNGTLRYYEEGELRQQEGWIEQDGERYYVNSDGTLRISRLFRDGDAAYYVDTVGRMVRGFFRVDDRLRYFDEDGRMREKAGWLKLDGEYYYVDEDGGIVTSADCMSAEPEDAPYIYMDEEETAGEPVGLYTVKGKDYIFDKKGVLLTGRIPLDAYSFYYTDEDGALLKDQDFTLEDITYHAGADGRVYVGTMYEKAQEYGSRTDYLILCNLTTQRTAVFEGEEGSWRLLREMLVSTGAPINPTPKGEYSTTVHTEHFNNYGVRAWYATGFIGGLYLFHSSPYEIDSEPKVCTDDRLGIPASHGCVRMRLEDAKWMYDWLPLDTKVVIYED